MPKESLNIYLTAVDQMSPVLASITDKTKALDKESQQLQQTYKNLQTANKALIERKTELQAKLKDINEEVKEARKAFNQYHDEASSNALNKAIEKQQALRNEIAGTTKALQENQKIYKENIETIRKGGLSSTDGAGGVMSALFASQIGQMWGSAVGDFASFAATSALGTPTASLLSDAASGAITGAIAGSVIPGVGTAAGAALGGIAGAISGGTKIFEAQDDAFKDYYGGLYQEASARSDSTVESGSTIAGGREKDEISFTTLFKDKDVAEQYLSDLVDMANTTPFLYDDLTGMSKTLATYGYDAQNILPQLQVIGDTGAALGMGTSDMTAVATALGRMKSSDKTTLEYLNILNDRGIGAVGMLADAKGVSVGDMYGMISKGEVSGTDAVEIITSALQELYSGSMLTQSQTYEGITSTLEGLTQELQNAAGEGYNTLRTEGKREAVEDYQGELGDAMKEINTIIGENRARKENLQGEYERQALDVVLNGKKGDLWGEIDEDSQSKLDDMHDELLNWKAQLEESKAAGDENGAALASANIEALYEEAQVMGQALFDNSEFMQALHETELDELQAILDNTAGLTEATKASYEVAQQLSKGRASAWVTPISFAQGEEGGGTKPITTFSDAMAMRGAPAMLPSKSHAYGLRRVPFDDYPALLHEGERVLTKSEAEHALLEDGPPDYEPASLSKAGASPRPTDALPSISAGRGLGPATDEDASLFQAWLSAAAYEPAPLSKAETSDTTRQEYPPLKWAAGGPWGAGEGGEYADTTPAPEGQEGARSGGGGSLQLTVTGNNFVGTGEEMADQLFEVMMRKIEVAWNAAGR